ncbi:hypothetical protein CHELA20_53417 [Hyphomicrobiales bacterium]|nr:hypothetical protein CHELA41_21512 [Hyphomicrobiales bacterium]CAH1684208.1 hypothetical protein CHELA20_53417 [Hyphomicrobiales bacterium]
MCGASPGATGAATTAVLQARFLAALALASRAGKREREPRFVAFAFLSGISPVAIEAQAVKATTRQ